MVTARRWVGRTEAALGIAGGALLTYGIGCWSQPAGHVAAGLLLITVAVWPAPGTRNREQKTGDRQ